MTSETEILLGVSTAIAWAHTKQWEEWQASKFRTPHLCNTYIYGYPPSLSEYSPSRAGPVVAEVLSQRASALVRMNISIGNFYDLRGGRLLRHNFGETTCTQTAQSITNGLFDEYDVPGWDTWAAFVHDTESADGALEPIEYLLCWIPPKLHDLVDQAINASMEENIIWLNNTNSSLTESLSGSVLLR